MRRIVLTLVAVGLAGTILCSTLTASTAHAAEGKWTPQQVAAQPPEWLTGLGIELPPEAFVVEQDDSPLRAVVRVGRGCSGALVSSDGLVVTNHHCAFSLLQRHSTLKQNLIETGFLAEDHSAELPGEGFRIRVPVGFSNVTDLIEDAVPADADDLERWRAIDRRSKQLVAECEERTGHHCDMATYDDGVRYSLVEALEFADVRLVWAPPRSVGSYGGEIDNWMWPRHSADATILRIWADDENQPAPFADDNQPYRPDVFIEPADTPLAAGDPVIVAGYPFSTARRHTFAEMRNLAELEYTARIDLLGAWMAIMEEAAGASDDAAVALAGRIKSLANRTKNARGQLAAIERLDLLGRRLDRDASVLTFAAFTPAHHHAASAYRQLSHLAEQQRATFARDNLLRSIRRGPWLLEVAWEVVRWSREQQRPDAERLSGYQQRDRAKLVDRLGGVDGQLHLPTEAALLADLVRRARELPTELQIEALAPLKSVDDEQLTTACAELLNGPVLDADSRLALLERTPRELHEMNDPLLEMAFALDDQRRALEVEEHRRQGAISRLRPIWRRAEQAWSGQPLAPDANATLRVSFGLVRGYSPRDAVWMRPQTTLAGVVAKHAGTAPFNAPERLLIAAEEAATSRWVDAQVGDVPVCFLADADTTGGNSGSPVLNARGRLVGLNFDRVWENVANDHGYTPEIARNVSVDLRYIGWILENVDNATDLLMTLGLDDAGAQLDEN